MRILLTGASGFIGRNACKHLKEYNVIALDRIYSEVECKSFMVEDLTHRIISGVCENIDVVIHLAAKTFVDHSIKDPRVFMENNFMGTFNLLEDARRYNVKRFIHISTDEVYGAVSEGFYQEDARLNPGNPYSASKAACDMLCLSYMNTYKMPITILRPENNYGPGQHDQKFIPTIIRSLVRGEPIPLYGDGKHKRMWLHVHDFCSAIEAVMNQKNVYRIYNVGAMDEHENIDIANRICEIMGKKPQFNYISDEIARPGHDRRYGINTYRIGTTGWVPKMSIHSHLREVVESYL